MRSRTPIRTCGSRPTAATPWTGIFPRGTARGLYIKLVISEKQEVLRLLGAEPALQPAARAFLQGEGSAPRRLHEYHWRRLMFARYGAFRAVHSWETVNEDTPDKHFPAGGVGQSSRGRRQSATLSTWASLATASWKHPNSAAISYVDFHASRSTGWSAEPKAELCDDWRSLIAEFATASPTPAGSPSGRLGGVGIDGQCPPDKLRRTAPKTATACGCTS